MKHCRSANPQCEKEGLRCNPSSSDVFIAAEGIGEELGEVGSLSLHPQRQHYTHNHNSHDRLCPDASNPSELCNQMHQTPPNCGDMHIESFVNTDSMCPTNDNIRVTKISAAESEEKISVMSPSLFSLENMAHTHHCRKVPFSRCREIHTFDGVAYLAYRAKQA